MIRKTVRYTGRVQGVGFRYTANRLARGFAVSGYVLNLPDRRVELVAEGDAKQVDAFLDAVSEAMGDKIHSTSNIASPFTGEFTDFSIRH